MENLDAHHKDPDETVGEHASRAVDSEAGSGPVLRAAVAGGLALAAYSMTLFAFQRAQETAFPATLVLMGGSLLLVVSAYRAIAGLGRATSEFWLDEQPLCPGCCEPVDPIEHFCPTCRYPSGKYTAYLPFEKIWFESHAIGRAWKSAWSRTGTGRIARRVGVLLLLALYSPPLCTVCVLAGLWGLRRRAPAPRA